MNRKKLLSLVMILLPICGFSQNTSTNIMQDTIHLDIPGPSESITSKQLKTANLIFLEHEQFSKEIPLLEEKISTLEEINKTWQHTDSLRQVQYKSEIDSLKKSKKAVGIVAIVSIFLNVLCLLVK